MRRCSILITVLAAACGGGTPPAPAPGGSSPVVESITGRERIGWNQPADSPAQLASFQYAIYIDGTRSELRGVACPAVADATGFNCSAALPPMTSGVHTLELAAFVQNGASVLESPRSPSLRVSLTASTVPVGAEGAFAGTESLADGATLRVERFVDGLNTPVDAAFAADGTLFLAERGGGIKVFAGGRPEPSAALRLPAGAEDGAPQILSIALDPDYARTHFVFVVEATPAAGGAALQIVRYREVRGRLGERAVTFQMASPVHPVAASAAIRFGPDTKVYLATGAPDGSGTLARLNPDGSMPRDQAGSVPDIASGIETVRGVDWDPRSNIVWIADEGDADTHLSALSLTPPPVRAAVRVRKRIAGRAGSLVFYRSEAVPSMRGDALLASAEGYIVRLRIDPDDPTRIEWVEKMFDRAAGPVRVVAVSPDGAIYFCTDSVLARLVPVQ